MVDEIEVPQFGWRKSANPPSTRLRTKFNVNAALS